MILDDTNDATMYAIITHSYISLGHVIQLNVKEALQEHTARGLV